MLTSGVSSSLSPLTGDWKATPCSLTLALAPSDQTWKPPLSVRIGRGQPSKRCRPPKRASTSRPGPQPEVEGVAEDDLGAHRLERRRQHALDAAVGADRHEDRRLDRAVVERRGGRAGPGLRWRERRTRASADCRGAARRRASRASMSRVLLRSSTIEEPAGRIDADAGRRAERPHAGARRPAVDPDLRRPRRPALRVERVADDAMAGRRDSRARRRGAGRRRRCPRRRGTAIICSGAACAGQSSAGASVLAQSKRPS